MTFRYLNEIRLEDDFWIRKHFFWIRKQFDLERTVTYVNKIRLGDVF